MPHGAVKYQQCRAEGACSDEFALEIMGAAEHLLEFSRQRRAYPHPRSPCPASSWGHSRAAGGSLGLRRVARARAAALRAVVVSPARGLPAALPRPIASFDGRKLETFFIGWYIRNAQGLPGVPPLDDARRELLAHFEASANDPALYLDMPFVPGDVQWLRNAFVLHERRAYVDHEEPARKRWSVTRRFSDAMPRFDQGGGVRG